MRSDMHAPGPGMDKEARGMAWHGGHGVCALRPQGTWAVAHGAGQKAQGMTGACAVLRGQGSDSLHFMHARAWP